MIFLSIKFWHIPVKLYVSSWKKQKNVYATNRAFIKSMNIWKEQNSINQIEDKPKIFIFLQNNNSNLHTFSKILSDYLNSIDKRVIYQKMDKPKVFIFLQNNNSNLHTFSKILFDNLNSLGKRIIYQKTDKLHSINQRQQIVECVLLSPLKA